MPVFYSTAQLFFKLSLDCAAGRIPANYHADLLMDAGLLLVGVIEPERTLQGSIAMDYLLAGKALPTESAAIGAVIR